MSKHFKYRFLLHVIPKGFVRIRHYGSLSHAKKRAALPTIRAALLRGTSAKISSSNPHSVPSCLGCGSARWLKVSELALRISSIEARNQRVELEKAWELSLTRKVSIPALTYLVMILVFWSLEN